MNQKSIFDLQYVGFEGKPSHQGPSPRRSPRARTAGLLAPRPARAITLAPEAVAERDEFFAWLLDRAGLDPACYRLEPLLRRLPACLRALKASSREDARWALEARPELLETAIGMLLIGVTSFFRDPAVFDCLRTEALPELARRGGPLRIWSLACSSGAELYSVAILLAEAGLLERSFLLGTDCRADAIAQAQSGLFSGEALQGLDPALRERYFLKRGQSWRIALPRQGEIAWRTANLWDRLEPGPWDLILFRNAVIYMAPQSAQRLWADLAAALRPGGALVVGKAERPVSRDLAFIKRCVYRKTGVGDPTYG